MKIYFKTFGCRTNIYDTEFMKNFVKSHEIVANEHDADIIVVNSCTVTNGADSDVRNYINRANRENKRVLMTGCGAISRGKELFDTKKVFGVFSMDEKQNIDEFLSRQTKFISINQQNKIDKNIVTHFENHAKAFIKIQEGCDFSCSYCIIPSVRGRARSLDEMMILNEAQNLIKNGFNELILTGTNIGSYGKDTGSNLGKLLQKIGRISGLKRVRLGSIEPSQIDESFREVLKESWIERHLHIALQHTSQKMLTIMRRRNRAFRDIELFGELANLGFALGTDYIVGHPGESDEIWAEALENFKKFYITHIHAFIYSPRDGTLSAKMGAGINGTIAKTRLKTLQNIVFLNNFQFRQNLRKNSVNLDVLIERKNGEYFEGYDQFYNKTLIKSDKNLTKKWVEIKDCNVETNANLAQL